MIFTVSQKKHSCGLKRRDDTPTKVWPTELLNDLLPFGDPMTTDHDTEGLVFFCVPCMNRKGKNRSMQTMRRNFNLHRWKEHKKSKSHVEAVKILVAEHEKKKRDAEKEGKDPKKLKSQKYVESYFLVTRRLQLRGVTAIPCGPSAPIETPAPPTPPHPQNNHEEETVR